MTRILSPPPFNALPPRQANLGDLSGLASGVSASNPMMDGQEFNGAKAYKDSKVSRCPLAR